MRIVGTLGLGFDQCNIFLARRTPKFATPVEAIKWLDGKQVAYQGQLHCDRFAQATLKKRASIQRIT